MKQWARPCGKTGPKNQWFKPVISENKSLVRIKLISAQWFVLSQKRTFKVHLSIVWVPEDIHKCTIHLCKAFSMLKNIFAYLKVLLLI